MDARPVADPVNATVFYALDGARLLRSTDGGVSFSESASAKGKLASAKGSRIIRAAPAIEGELWVALYDGGLARSLDGGKTLTNVRNVSYAGAVGFGKAAPDAARPTVYLWGSVGGVRGMFCSPDNGVRWERINDAAHQYGGPGNGQFVVGDMNSYGVIYMSTAGRGIVYGKPPGAAWRCAAKHNLGHLAKP